MPGPTLGDGKHHRIAQNIALERGTRAQPLPLRQDQKRKASDRMHMQASHGIEHRHEAVQNSVNLMLQWLAGPSQQL